jgi:hypothetical protein
MSDRKIVRDDKGPATAFALVTILPPGGLLTPSQTDWWDAGQRKDTIRSVFFLSSPYVT